MPRETGIDYTRFIEQAKTLGSRALMFLGAIYILNFMPGQSPRPANATDSREVYVLNLGDWTNKYPTQLSPDSKKIAYPCHEWKPSSSNGPDTLCVKDLESKQVNYSKFNVSFWKMLPIWSNDSKHIVAYCENTDNTIEGDKWMYCVFNNDLSNVIGVTPYLHPDLDNAMPPKPTPTSTIAR